MKLERLGPNVTKIFKNDMTILFSYDMPVGVFVLSDGGKYYVTDYKHSVTTSKHINKWLSKTSRPIERVSQETIERMVNEGV